MSDLKPPSAASQAATLAVQASWEYVRRELEASDPHVARKRAPFLSRLYHAMQRTFAALEDKVADGRLDPLVQLNVLAQGSDERRAELHPLERPARVGFFPIGGNPIWWGHLLAGLMAMQALELYAWPGNIRELQNEIMRLISLIGEEEVIRFNMLSNAIQDFFKSRRGKGSLERNVENFERRLILKALDENDWNRIRTAKQIGIPRTTLLTKMKRLKITK